MRNTAIAFFVTFAFFSSGIFLADAQERDDAPLVPPYDYHFTDADVLYASQACVHEDSWSGGSRNNDCGAMIQVFMEVRRAGETFRDAIRRRMPRFAAGVTDRAWVLNLPSGPIRRSVEGWPYGYPARVHSDDWRSVVFRVHGYLRGSEPLPCEMPPVRWFGRTTDGEQLAAALEDDWCEAACGTTANAFLHRCPEVDPE